MLQEMKSHPVQPSSEIFRHQLQNDILSFDALLNEETKIDDDILRMVPENEKLIHDYQARFKNPGCRRTGINWDNYIFNNIIFQHVPILF